MRRFTPAFCPLLPLKFLIRREEWLPKDENAATQTEPEAPTIVIPVNQPAPSTNTNVPTSTLVGSKRRAVDDLEANSPKRQKLVEDKVEAKNVTAKYSASSYSPLGAQNNILFLPYKLLLLRTISQQNPTKNES